MCQTICDVTSSNFFGRLVQCDLNLRGNVTDQNLLGNLAYIFLIICLHYQKHNWSSMPEQAYIYYVRIQERSTVDWFLRGVSNLWNGLMEWNIS